MKKQAFEDVSPIDSLVIFQPIPVSLQGSKSNSVASLAILILKLKPFVVSNHLVSLKFKTWRPQNWLGVKPT